MRRGMRDVLSIQHHRTTGRCIKTRQDIQCRGFTRSVRTDQRMHTATLHRKRDFINRFQTTKMLRQRFNDKHIFRMCLCLHQFELRHVGREMKNLPKPLQLLRNKAPDTIRHKQHNQNNRQTVNCQIKPRNRFQEPEPLRNKDQQSRANDSTNG